MSEQKIAVVLIRGLIGITKTIKDTLLMLNLGKKHACVVVKATPANLGMIHKVKNYVTYGIIDEETEKLLKEKREEKKILKDGKEGVKKFYRLSPPKGGFERKGIKKPYTVGGALGDRKEKINELLKRMI